MTAPPSRHRLPGGQPTLQRQRGPLIIQLLRPLGVPALIALVLTLWPLFQFLWLFGILTVLPGWLIWLRIRHHSPSAVKARAEADRIRQKKAQAMVNRYAKQDLALYGLIDTPENRNLVASWNSFRNMERKRSNIARDRALKALEDAGLKQSPPRTWQEWEDEFDRRYGLTTVDADTLRARFAAWRNGAGSDVEGFTA